MKRLLTLTLLLGLFSFSVLAQDQPAASQPSPLTEEQEKEKAERERNAYRLLDQVIDEAQSLHLTENRVRIQINAADMLWDQNQARARSLFSMAGESIAELGRTQVAALNRRSNPTGPNFAPPNLRSFQLRQELVLTAARHDATLAYQLLAVTKPALPPQTTDDPRARGIASDDNLEQSLLSRVAALDPKLAAQNAELMLDRGQFPFTLPQVIGQLQRQDPDAANKLTDKVVKKLQATNFLTNLPAATLVQTMLVAGPRPPGEPAADSAAKQQPLRGWPAVLEQSTYVDLLTAAVDTALKATPAQNNQRPARPMMGRVSGSQQPQTDAQTEQNNARRLLAGLQSLMPMIDQFLPAKAAQVRQKMTEMGMPPSPGLPYMGQVVNGIEGEPTTDALVQAAATAPPQMQSRIYQQAAYKALDEGDTERARQIATDHLQSNVRDAVMKRIDFREMTKKAEATRIEDVRQAVARLQSDNEKLDLLLQFANDTQKSNPKLALQVLEDARQLTNHRATGYDHFEQQLKVAHAFASVDPARSFEVLDPGISHINELLSAAALLSGFEMNMFRDGEMAIQNGNGLTSTINRFGQELALLARSDFERSEALAGRFQFPEARIMARMAIVQGLLGTRPVSGNTRGFVSSDRMIRQD
ncbi:MAG TPA: hypothetical protein VGP59_08015 [Pyrinomonadaceae bacterium]|nr:hypothetical protein [Pyrinomonadaceae bacterium]